MSLPLPSDVRWMAAAVGHDVGRGYSLDVSGDVTSVNLVALQASVGGVVGGDLGDAAVLEEDERSVHVLVG